MASQERQLPGTRPTETEETVDEKSLAQGERTLRAGEEQNLHPCIHCLDGWVFLGSLDHDGEEVVESIRYCRCGGTGRVA
jgi:hypothetical protein